MSKVDSEKHIGEQPTLSHTEEHVGEPPKMGYRHPLVQIMLVSFICFTCPGMFNALSGLGGGGQIDTTTNSRGSTALNSTFAVMAFFGTSSSRLEIELYPFGVLLSVADLFVSHIAPSSPVRWFFRQQARTASLAHPRHHRLHALHRFSAILQHSPRRVRLTFFRHRLICFAAGIANCRCSKFTIAAGAILGICAGLLWTAQGVLMLAYSTEATKGRYIAIFWAIFNLGAVIGAAVPLGQQVKQIADTSVGNEIYIAFVVITALGGAATFALAKPSTIRRADGSQAVVPVNQSWLNEFINVGRALVSDPAILFLFPFFGASNFFYTWQFSFYNLVLFNPRTRSLNNLLYWSSQILGAGLMGWFLDSPKLGRKLRAKIGWAILFVIIVATWGGNYAFQKGLNRVNTDKDYLPAHHKIDWTESKYGGACFLYIMNGITDAAWQTYSYCTSISLE